MRRDDDQAIERLLTGGSGPDDPRVVAAVGQLRALAQRPVTGARAEDHIARAASEAGARSPSGTSGTNVVPIWPRKRSTPVRQLVAVAAAFLVLVTGLGAAGALPDAIQSELADIVRPLGIDLPDAQPGGDDDDDGTRGRGERPVTPDPTSAPIELPGPPGSVPGPPPTGPPPGTPTGPAQDPGPPPGTPAGPPEGAGPPG